MQLKHRTRSATSKPEQVKRKIKEDLANDDLGPRQGESEEKEGKGRSKTPRGNITQGVEAITSITNGEPTGNQSDPLLLSRFVIAFIIDAFVRLGGMLMPL